MDISVVSSPAALKMLLWETFIKMSSDSLLYAFKAVLARSLSGLSSLMALSGVTMGILVYFMTSEGRLSTFDHQCHGFSRLLKDILIGLVSIYS